MENKTCVVTVQLMQTVVRYLETKPFAEVHSMISAILKQANAGVPDAAEPAAPSSDAPAETDVK